MTSCHARAGLVAPLPLLMLFGAFLVAIAYLIAASLTRRDAPVFPPSPSNRARVVGWQSTGDTLTVDATDGESWRYVSLAQGRVLTPPDTASWDIAVQRYRVITPQGTRIADLGRTTFERAQLTPFLTFVSTMQGSPPENVAIEHWYRYNLLTHLLEPNGHVFAVQTPSATWKLAVVSYYCPKLVAGCLTISYAPMVTK